VQRLDVGRPLRHLFLLALDLDPTSRQFLDYHAILRPFLGHGALGEGPEGRLELGRL
jgi:hypothetical protein